MSYVRRRQRRTDVRRGDRPGGASTAVRRHARVAIPAVPKEKQEGRGNEADHGASTGSRHGASCT